MNTYSWLPRIYRQIARRSGVDAALGLARARGGERISVPKKPNEWMILAMGAAGAATLSELYGGEVLDLPIDPVSGMGQKARARRIGEAIARGTSVNAIVRAHGVSRRQVYNHKRKHRAAQPDLFSHFDAPPKKTVKQGNFFTLTAIARAPYFC